MEEQITEGQGENSEPAMCGHEDPTIQAIFENILLCKEAIRQITWFEDKMFKGYFGDRKNSVKDLEDNILASSLSELIDGIFYCLVCHESETIMLRYFESGAFLSFFGSELLPHLKQELCSETDVKVIPYAIYNCRDIDAANSRQNKLYMERRKEDRRYKKYKIFERNIYNNKKGVAQSIIRCDKDMKEGKLHSSFLICCVMAKSQKYQDNVDKQGRDRQRFFFASKDAEYWNEKLSIFRSNPSTEQEQVFSIFDSHAVLSVDNQYAIINQIPNFHKWIWPCPSKYIIEYSQRFCICTRRYPGSPRNRIIQAFCRKNCNDIILDCLENVFGGKTVRVRYPKKKGSGNRKRKIEEAVGVEKKIKNKNISDVCIDKKVQQIDVNGIEEVIQIQNIDGNGIEEVNQENTIIVENVSSSNHEDNIQESSQEISLFGYYCSELFRNGFLAWRVLTEDVNIVLMNNYTQKTGNFLKNDYVHVRTDLVDGIYHVTCTCRMFAIVDSVSSLCCHSRLISLILSDTVMEEFKFINKAKVSNAKMLADVSVLKLKPKSGIDRFSVKGDDGTVEFVTLFKIPKFGKTVAKCHSRLCRISERSSRSIKNIGKSVRRCSHLKAFRTFYLTQALASNLNFDVSSIDEMFEYVDDTQT